MVTKLPWQRNWYINNSCFLNHIEFIFSIKLPWHNRHRLHTSMPQQLGCHANCSDTSITPLSLDVLNSYLAWDFLGTLNISQIIRYYGYWVTMAPTVIHQLLLCLKLYWIHVWYGAFFQQDLRQRSNLYITVVAKETYLSHQQGMWLMPFITRVLHAKYDLNRTQDIEVIKVSLWLPWQSSYHSN